MKTILLNVIEETVEVIDIEPELDAYYRALDCTTIDIVERKIGRKRYDIMCDDEGLFRDPQKISAIDNLGRPMLVGNLMFFNNDGSGNLTDLSDNDIRYIMQRIIYMYTHQYPKGYKMLTQCEY